MTGSTARVLKLAALLLALICGPCSWAAPSGSLLMPEDIAEAALYWVSPASRPISGTVFEAEQYPMIGRIPNQEHQPA
jgi:hypothetical protein